MRERATALEAIVLDMGKERPGNDDGAALFPLSSSVLWGLAICRRICTISVAYMNLLAIV